MAYRGPVLLLHIGVTVVRESRAEEAIQWTGSRVDVLPGSRPPGRSTRPRGKGAAWESHAAPEHGLQPLIGICRDDP